MFTCELLRVDNSLCITSDIAGIIQPRNVYGLLCTGSGASHSGDSATSSSLMPPPAAAPLHHHHHHKSNSTTSHYQEGGRGGGAEGGRHYGRGSLRSVDQFSDMQGQRREVRRSIATEGAPQVWSTSPQHVPE